MRIRRTSRLAAPAIGLLALVLAQAWSPPAGAAPQGRSEVLPHGPAGVIVPSASVIAFGNQRTGTYGGTRYLTLTNQGPGTLAISGVGLTGPDLNDFGGDGSACTQVLLAAGQSCTISLLFSPESTGSRSALLVEQDDTGMHAVTTLSGIGTSGYWVLSAAGGISPFGDAAFYGQFLGQPLNAPMVSIAATPNGAGSWLLAQDGGVFALGDAAFYGSTGSLKLNEPVVGMTGTPDGAGYWLVASDGGVFAFGDAAFYGSTGSLKLNEPVVGMAETPDGAGYWLVASDGGVFAFGDAAFYGSTGSLKLNEPVVGMATSPDGAGYLMVASDGGVFALGDAAYEGSAAGTPLAAPIVGIAETSDGLGYWMVGADGGVLNAGDAPFYGSAVGTTSSPVVSMAATGGPALQLLPASPHAVPGSTWSATGHGLAPLRAPDHQLPS